MTSTTSNATTRGQRILIALISNKEPTFPDTPPGHALLKYVTRVYEVAKYLLDCPETELSLCEAHMANKFVYEPTGVPTTAAKLTKIMADDNEPTSMPRQLSNSTTSCLVSSWTGSRWRQTNHSMWQRWARWCRKAKHQCIRSWTTWQVFIWCMEAKNKKKHTGFAI